jgi:hypothetical protein
MYASHQSAAGLMSWCEANMTFSLLYVALHNLKFLLYDLEPVVGIHWLHGVRDSRWLGPLEVSKPVPLMRL